MSCVMASGRRGIGRWACAISRKRSSALSIPKARSGIVASEPAQREIEQHLEILIAAVLGGLEGFDQVAQLGVEQRVDRGVGFGGDDLGALEQVTIDGAGEIHGG